MKYTLLFVCAVAFLCAGAEPAHAATTFYVSTTGRDDWPGTSSMPFLTIQKAASTASAGDTVIVRPGTYAGARFSRSGTALAPIVVLGEPGARVDRPGPQNSVGDNIWLRDANWVTITGFEIYNAVRAGIAVNAEPDAESLGIVLRNNVCHNNGVWGIFTAYAKGIVIEGNETSYSGEEHGIYVSNSSDDPVLRRNIAHDNHLSGIQINADPAFDGDGIISNAIVTHNVIYNNGAGGAAGINLASVTNSLIANNLLYDNLSTGIAGWDDDFDPAFGTHHNTIVFNTVYQAPTGRWALSLLHGSHTNVVRDNVLLHPGTRGSIDIDSSSEVGIDSNHNIINDRFSLDEVFLTAAQWRARNHDASSVVSTAAAVFANHTADNYHLKSGGPAIGIGVAVSGIANDLDGDGRPQGGGFDAGALEFRGADTPGVYVPTTRSWFLKNANAAGSADINFTFGAVSASYIPIAGDWDGDGLDSIGIYDQATGTFLLRNATAGGSADVMFRFGASGRVPIVGDWNGDGVDTVGIFEPSTSTFFLKNTNAGGPADITVGFGPDGANWTPIAGDWNGDGTDTIGLYAPLTSKFFLRNRNAPGAADLSFSFGPASAQPLTGDWNADGIDTIAVYVPATRTRFLKNTNSAGNADTSFTYGPANVIATRGDWNSL